MSSAELQLVCQVVDIEHKGSKEENKSKTKCRKWVKGMLARLTLAEENSYFVKFFKNERVECSHRLPPPGSVFLCKESVKKRATLSVYHLKSGLHSSPIFSMRGFQNPDKFHEFEKKLRNTLREMNPLITYGNDSFEELLRRDNSATIHHRNLQKLAIEIYEIKNGISIDINKDLINNRDITSNLRKKNTIASNMPHTEKYVFSYAVKIMSDDNDFLFHISSHWLCLTTGGYKNLTLSMQQPLQNNCVIFKQLVVSTEPEIMYEVSITISTPDNSNKYRPFVFETRQANNIYITLKDFVPGDRLTYVGAERHGSVQSTDSDYTSSGMSLRTSSLSSPASSVNTKNRAPINRDVPPAPPHPDYYRPQIDDNRPAIQPPPRIEKPELIVDLLPGYVEANTDGLPVRVEPPYFVGLTDGNDTEKRESINESCKSSVSEYEPSNEKYATYKGPTLYTYVNIQPCSGHVCKKDVPPKLPPRAPVEGKSLIYSSMKLLKTESKPLDMHLAIFARSEVEISDIWCVSIFLLKDDQSFKIVRERQDCENLVKERPIKLDNDLKCTVNVDDKQFQVLSKCQQYVSYRSLAEVSTNSYIVIENYFRCTACDSTKQLLAFFDLTCVNALSDRSDYGVRDVGVMVKFRISDDRKSKEKPKTHDDIPTLFPLSPLVRMRICDLLDVRTAGCQDWRHLAAIFELDMATVRRKEMSESPTEEILRVIEQRQPQNCTLELLKSALREMQRLDALHEI